MVSVLRVDLHAYVNPRTKAKQEMYAFYLSDNTLFVMTKEGEETFEHLLADVNALLRSRGNNFMCEDEPMDTESFVENLYEGTVH